MKKNLFSVMCCVVMFWAYGTAHAREVCVSINKKQIKISKDYFSFSPTIKGINYWAKNDPSRLKPVQCEDEAVDVTISFFWPDMSPAGDAHIKQTSKFEHVTASIKPKDFTPNDMGYLQDILTTSATTEQKNKAQFDSRYKLYSFQGYGVTSKRLYTYYWANMPNDKPWVFFMCSPLITGELFTCKGHYFLSEIQSLITISFPPSLMGNWSDIIKDTNKFVLSKLHAPE